MAWLSIPEAITQFFVFTEQYRLEDEQIAFGIYRLWSFSTLNTWSVWSKFTIFILLPLQIRLLQIFSTNYYFSFLDVDLNI